MSFLKNRKNLYFIFLGAPFLFCFFLVSIYFSITLYSQKYLYTDIGSLPAKKVGIVLGTSPWFADGSPNIFFEERMRAAIKLFEAKKIEYILVSGDNRTEKYNEPRMMKKFLVSAGIPSEKIIEDFAGLRTLDSVLRGFLVFGQKDMVIISQKFHNERAVFIARSNDIEAIAFNADSGSVVFVTTTKNLLREVGARMVAVYDVLTKTTPRFLGDMISI